MSGVRATALLQFAGNDETVLREATTGTFIADVEVVDLPAAEQLWRSFEAIALASPYQRYDWVAAYVRAVHAQDGSSACAIVCRDAGGVVQVILPLLITRRMGLTVAEYIGGKHANLNMPLLSQGAIVRLDAPAWHDILCRAARAHGMHAFFLMNQPRVWRGHRNLLAELGAVAASEDVYMLSLAPDADTVLGALLSKERQRKLRAKVRRLSTLGEIRFTDPDNDAERREAIAAFLEQKGARLRELGIPDPFAKPEIRRFFEAASASGPAGEPPAIEFHALKAGNRVVATIAGCGDAVRFSTMCVSFDMTHDIARDSPGDQILLHLIRRQSELGRTEFDLGVGEAQYKETYCNQREQLSHGFVAVSAAGAALVTLERARNAAKHAVKRHPALLRLVRKLPRRG